MTKAAEPGPSGDAAPVQRGTDGARRQTPHDRRRVSSPQWTAPGLDEYAFLLRGHIDPPTLERAGMLASQWQVSPHAVLIAMGWLREVDYVRALAGHWGVPLFVFDNDPFFGQDRIDALLWRLEQHGLKRKT